jgi:hypothetical protein
MSSDLQTISFIVPAPSHYFQPWAFRLSVDTPGDPPDAFGIRSPNIYITKSQTTGYQLQYSTSTGAFALMDGGSSQAGAVFAAQLVLVNVICPYNNFTIEATTDDGSPITFSSPTPIQWSSPTDPIWIRWTGDQPNLLFVSINSGAAGQSVGLQFQIEYNGLTILSPDPILINSTIGDG